MSSEKNKTLFQQVVMMWQHGDLEKVEELNTPDYVGHVSQGDRDREGLKARIQAFCSIYPDVVFTIHDQMTDGDKVISRLSACGTHSATGKLTELIGINISRVVDGKVAEEWATWEVKS